MNQQFIKDVEQGLSRKDKFLLSKYFYDQKGDALFVKIMHLPEYYLTRAEFEILQKQAADIVQKIGFQKDQEFEIVELGAGDGKKTKEFIRHLVNEGFKFKYEPIDISKNVLDILQKSMLEAFPKLNISIKQGEYFEILDDLKNTQQPKLVLFLGSNIGNMKDVKARKFLKQLGQKLNKGDHLLLGVDLIKPAEIVVPAYNDSSGITAAFNLNVLERINRELEGNFDLDSFEHQVEYNEKEGIVKSYLCSLKKQKVEIKALGKSFQFEKGEKIHTEISRKYNTALIDQITADTHFDIKGKFTDSNTYFADYLLVKT